VAARRTDDAPVPGSRPTTDADRLRPGAHGDDARRVAGELGIDPTELLDLAATLNPVAPDLTRAVAAAAASVRWYPDATRATDALAERIGVEPTRLVLTNGGAEAIALVAALHPHGSIDAPEFALYERHLRALDEPSRRWASNPNNPTGLLAAEHDQAFVWDEAHHVLATGQWSRGDADAIVVGSLTKAFACPGLRVGYAIGRDRDEAAQLRARQPAWPVNAIACEVIPSLLETTDVTTWPGTIGSLRADLADLLRRRGYEPQPSDAPWLLVPRTPTLRSELLRHRVLVRDCTSFGLDGCTRIAVPDADGLERLAGALERLDAER
jgi:histidinol-phosphate/aromatic aminotransferase/cobyric acid decarboxylase-like protein